MICFCSLINVTIDFDHDHFLKLNIQRLKFGILIYSDKAHILFTFYIKIIFDTQISEVKFSDLLKTNLCESICQGYLTFQ